ncbi:galactose oxidase [Desarmillaria tabescens]|uniref:Galactose oxidase n=1 Tax=Armillaria tabescens TaxID=1929756 RepID=A0AA39MWQ8_ARMTA|nr:galactose oxidase [Desarmillaria tabescens]KAK0449028.1 galactose oxidase [Desarmillaria tabescens]
MAKKKAPAGTKATAKAAKKAKAAQKVERKEKKKVSKSKDEVEEDDDDLEGILERMQREWEEAHTVTEELVEGPPSRRVNATLTACPNGNHLWCIGGEFFSDDGKAYFYNDVFRYSPEKDEWRRFVSKICPGPRSAHAVVASPSSGGKIFLFGGEFSSLHQNTFHHYRDFWCFDITTHSWDRIDTKIRPSARSGHRMAIWKQYIVLFGGFYDPGVTTRYLNDLWLFDTQEYKWRQVEFKDTEPRPSARSGFSFLSTPDGIVLHGGYCKEYVKGKRPIECGSKCRQEGKSTADPLKLKWERRKRPSTAYAPSLRSGCTMAAWAPRNTGVMFGGVTDEDTSEETLRENGYQWTGKGKWVSMTLKRPKKAGGTKKKKPTKKEDDGDDDTMVRTLILRLLDTLLMATLQETDALSQDAEVDPDDPSQTLPLPRYNAMLAVLRNTLYLYGGIFEKGSREYTLDDFYSLQLDKMDRYVCLKESGVVIVEGDDESSSDSEDDDGDDDDDEDGHDETMIGDDEAATFDKEPDEIAMLKEVEEVPETQAEKDALRAQATTFMGVARDNTRSAEDVISTPLPGETLAMFYSRSREYWAQKAHATSDSRGKQLRRDGFTRAKERYAEYKPILQEVEKILAEAGLDEEEMRKGAAVGPGSGGGQSRNRR